MYVLYMYILKSKVLGTKLKEIFVCYNVEMS